MISEHPILNQCGEIFGSILLELSEKLSQLMLDSELLGKVDPLF
jgi:hypothetical protein